MRVVGDEGENLGVLAIEKALALAKEKELDLVLIAPDTKPPVARITSFDKFRYQKEKEEKKQRLAQKSAEMKQIRVSPKTAKNDLRIKADQTDKFLEKGHRVEINLVLKGREKAHRDWGLQKLQGFLEMIKVPYKVVSEPKKTGRGGFATQIVKK